MEKCIFIGYPLRYKGWKFYNPETKKVIICERADFDERYTYWGELMKSGTPSTDSEPELKSLIPLDDESPSDSDTPPKKVDDEIVNIKEESESENESEVEQPVVVQPQPDPNDNDSDEDDNRPPAT